MTRRNQITTAFSLFPEMNRYLSFGIPQRLKTHREPTVHRNRDVPLCVSFPPTHEVQFQFQWFVDFPSDVVIGDGDSLGNAETVASHVRAGVSLPVDNRCRSSVSTVGSVTVGLAVPFLLPSHFPFPLMTVTGFPLLLNFPFVSVTTTDLLLLLHCCFLLETVIACRPSSHFGLLLGL
jgi:hypothetical protein